MIIITRGKLEDFARRLARGVSTIDRLKINLCEYPDFETFHFAGLRAGKTEILPIDSIWERDHETPIFSRYTEYPEDRKKYGLLRQVDRVVVHSSPENFSLEKRVSCQEEVLPFGDEDIHKKLEQYQVVVAPNGNALVRTIYQFNVNTKPQINKIIYLNTGGNVDEEPTRILEITRRSFLTEIFNLLPKFEGVNILTDKEHGRELRTIVPDCSTHLVYTALNSAGYTKRGKK